MQTEDRREGIQQTDLRENVGENERLLVDNQLSDEFDDEDIFGLSELEVGLEDEEDVREDTSISSRTSSDNYNKFALAGFKVDVTRPITDLEYCELTNRLRYSIGTRKRFNEHYEHDKSFSGLGVATNQVKDDLECLSVSERIKMSILAEIKMYESRITGLRKKALDATNIACKDDGKNKSEADLQIRIAAVTSDVSKVFREIAMNTIRQKVTNGIRMTPEDKKELLDKIYDAETPEARLAYNKNPEFYAGKIDSITNVIELWCTYNEHNMMHQRVGDHNIHLIFTQEEQKLKHLRNRVESGEISYAHQFSYNAQGECTYTCQCGKCITVKQLCHVILLNLKNGKDNKDVVSLMLPHVIDCECGKGYVLSAYDLGHISYAALSTDEENLGRLNSFSKATQNATAAGGIYNYYISGKKAKRLMWRTAIEQESTSIQTAAEKSGENSVNYVVPTQYEYEKAAKNFYSRLNMIPGQSRMIYSDAFTIYDKNKKVWDTLVKHSTENSLLNEEDPLKDGFKCVTDFVKENKTTYGFIAAYVCNRSSINYKQQKVKALYSLILSIYSNPAIRAYTHLGDRAFMYENFRVLESCKNVQSIEILPQSLASHLIQMEGWGDFDFVNHDVAKLLAQVPRVYGVYKKRLEDLDTRLEKLKEILYSYEDLLIFTKILNVSNIRIEEALPLLADEEMCNFLNKVADRMLITNYGEKSIDFDSKVASDLSKVEDANMFNAAIASYIQRDLEHFRSRINAQSMPSLRAYLSNKYFRLGRDTSTLGLAVTSDAYDFIKQCNYVEAIKVLHNCNYNSKQLSDLIQKDLAQVIGRINAFYDKHSDLFAKSTQAIYLSLAGFAEDELDENIQYVGKHKRIPLRRDNETLEEYSNRVTSGERYEYVESYEFVQEIMEDLLKISLVASVCKLEVSNFINTAFMICLSDMLVNEMKEADVYLALRINIESVNVYTSQIYKPNIFAKMCKNLLALINCVHNPELSDITEVFRTRLLDKLVLNQSSDVSTLAEDIISLLKNYIEKYSMEGKPIPIAGSESDGATGCFIEDYNVDLLFDEIDSYFKE